MSQVTNEQQEQERVEARILVLDRFAAVFRRTAKGSLTTIYREDGRLTIFRRGYLHYWCVDTGTEVMYSQRGWENECDALASLYDRVIELETQ